LAIRFLDFLISYWIYEGRAIVLFMVAVRVQYHNLDDDLLNKNNSSIV